MDKEYRHNHSSKGRKIDLLWMFRGDDPDKRTCRQWVTDMHIKHGINWINENYTKYVIDIEDGINRHNPKSKK